MHEYQPLGYSRCHLLVAFLVFALVALNDSGTHARYTNCNDFHSVIQGCLPLSFSSDIRWWHVESHVVIQSMAACVVYEMMWCTLITGNHSGESLVLLSEMQSTPLWTLTLTYV